MSPLTLHALKRLALYALVAAALLAGLPPLLREFGWLGPGPAEQVASAGRAIEAAREYGADERQPSFAAALAEHARAQRAAAAGERLSAVRAARDARRHAVASQGAALAERAELARRAGAVIEELDAALIALDAHFESATRGRPRREQSAQISLMKATRQSVARLFVAFEQGDHRAVVEGRAQALATLAAASAQLGAAP